jgi:cytochrome b involved in lipid metabolism
MTNVALHQLLEDSLVIRSQPHGEPKSLSRTPSAPLFPDAMCVNSFEELNVAKGISPPLQHDPMECDACSVCDDVCDNSNCNSCRSKARCAARDCASSPHEGNKKQRYYTPCQIRRHNHAGSAWLVAGDTVYDATPYLSTSAHPGGTESILKRAGGAQDCSRDLQFHSALGKRMFRKFEIGKVRACQSCNARSNSKSDPSKQWWSMLFQ